MEENLPELRDIHLPDGVSIWPPAYGWFVILLSIAAVFLLYELYRLWRRKSKKLYVFKINFFYICFFIPNNYYIIALFNILCVILVSRSNYSFDSVSNVCFTYFCANCYTKSIFI